MRAVTDTVPPRWCRYGFGLPVGTGAHPTLARLTCTDRANTIPLRRMGEPIRTRVPVPPAPAGPTHVPPCTATALALI